MYFKPQNFATREPLFANLNQESSENQVAFSYEQLHCSNVSNPRNLMHPLIPLDDSTLSAKSTTGIYLPLPEGDSFRLLEILPGKSGIVQCKLHICSLKENKMAYEALSYTWGKTAYEARYQKPARDQKIRVTANGKNHLLSVSENLNIALRELRRSNVPRLIWADAVCINQEDVKERSQQVVMMGEIFSGAWQVIIWLGEEFDRCSCGKTILEAALSSASEAFSGICSVVNEWLIQCGQEDLKATYSEVSRDGQSVLHHAKIRNDATPDSEYEACRFEMMQLFRRRWFSRIWVLQEAVLASHAIIQLGSYQIPWEWVGLAAAITVHKPELSLNDFGEIIPTGAMHCYFMYRLSISQRCFPPLKFSFAHLLQVTRLFESKDPKDKIYGLLGIATTDSIAIKIIPDYRKETTIEKVYEDVARLMLESNSPLTFLSGAGTFGDFDPSRPSWVPSWHRYRPWTILPTKKHPGFRCALSALMEMDRTNQPGQLSLKGVILGRIHSMQEVLGQVELFDQNERERQIFLSRPRWSEGDWKICALTLTCGGEGRAYPVDDEATHLADMAAAVLSGKLNWVMKDLITLESVIESKPGDVTQLEYLNEIAKDGDWRRYISAITPFHNFYRVFVTEANHFGLGPMDMKIGDQLCVLFGAEVPFLLRPKGDGYLIVGECYVYEVMHGEVLEKISSCPDGPLKASWIKLI
ncbi:heterokaryon incompatibility protein-domain-containing protein [Fusarium redolens]|uniref:Heterokaryon incompatibility protein-domain-containing protein n=1 Tax=Fusarium redolens TaxID=48865 RepID=A0A9P9FZU9_FUSRE|nr:heterokaryon incompatibility protein-domain-containing protein [Fusarium redolens]KAH7220449.1 heterokaryon incompatibility protein-domain-containing protein [Fusarium redolens]